MAKSVAEVVINAFSDFYQKAFSGFGHELVDRLREDVNAHLDDVAIKERIIGIGLAITALREVNASDEEIIALLQKYWDLRLSEAERLLQRAKEIE